LTGIGTSVLLTFLLVFAYLTVHSIRTRKREPATSCWRLADTPLARWAARRASVRFGLLRSLRGLALGHDEYGVGPGKDVSECAVTFFVPRRPLELRIRATEGELPQILDVTARIGDRATSLPHRLDRRLGQTGPMLRVQVLAAQSVDRVLLKLESSGQVFSIQVEVNVVRQRCAAHELLREARQHARSGDPGRARGLLHDYLGHSRINPHAWLLLGQVQLELAQLERAALCGLRAADAGLHEQGLPLYQAAREKDRGGDPTGEVKQLRARAAEWKPPDNPGVIALRHRRRYFLGLGGHHLLEHTEYLEIRRRAAGRLLGRVGFPLVAGRQHLLRSELQIVRAGGDVEKIPDEFFTVGDSEDRNPFIATQEEKFCAWILPDVDVGDVIVWSYEVLRQDSRLGENPQPFILADLAHAHHPTLDGSAAFIVPKDLSVRFLPRNADGIRTEELPEGTRGRPERTHVFTLNRQPRERNSGVPFGHYLLGPIVGCAAMGATWPDVARQSRQDIAPERPEPDPLPEPLSRVVADAGEPAQALRRAFYWIRDHIRYAAVDSAQAHVGRDLRAAAIVGRGVGDCKDKTYLLSLVCRELGIPHQMLAVSTETGLVVNELPGMQFNHVFLRARPGSTWRYLDASNPLAVYTGAPLLCQGLSALLLADEPEVVTIPVDDPETNGLAVTVRLTDLAGGWVQGDVLLHAVGVTARYIDEHWKGLTLGLTDPRHAAQETFRQVLRGLVVDEFAKETDTGTADALDLTCRGRLCGALPLEDRLVSHLTCRVPGLPVASWGQIELGPMFVFPFPLRVELTVEIQGAARARLADVSRVEGLETEICSIDEQFSRDDRSASLRRTVVLPRRIVEGEQVADLPDVFAAIERALQVAVAFTS